MAIHRYCYCLGKVKSFERFSAFFLNDATESEKKGGTKKTTVTPHDIRCQPTMQHCHQLAREPPSLPRRPQTSLPSSGFLPSLTAMKQKRGKMPSKNRWGRKKRKSRRKRKGRPTSSVCVRLIMSFVDEC